MTFFKLSTVLKISTGDEYWYIVQPSVTRRSRKDYPGVIPRDLDEASSPCPTTRGVLLIKYKERILDGYVLLDVMPGVNCDITATRETFLRINTEPCSLLLPIQAVSLLGCCDNVNILRGFVLHVILQTCDSLACSHTTPKDTSVVHTLNGV